MTILSLFLAILGLGFLVFIHELGHYLVARKKGMRVEAFSIGFGRPIWSREIDGVKWQLGILPFGGYVKIAGMQKEGSREPYEIADGFYGKKPLDRIWVALAGPLVNMGFALLVFTVIWLSDGRDKPFADFTHRIGWVDPQSTLYANGVRPGDLIQKYDGKPFTGLKDLVMASLMKGETTRIEGTKIDYLTGQTSHFDYTLKTYPNPELAGKDKFNTIGLLAPASYLIYPGHSLVPHSPMLGSGIEPKDRILWADGEVLFSHAQLSALTNESSVFLTVERGEQVFHTKVPRVKLADLKMTPPERGEIDDWQHEAGLKGALTDLYFIPYNLSPNLDIEGRLDFLDEADQKRAFGVCERCSFFTPLVDGDKILAIDGTRVASPYEMLFALQARKMLLIVDRDPTLQRKVSWHDADAQFDDFSTNDLQRIVDLMNSSKS